MGARRRRETLPSGPIRMLDDDGRLSRRKANLIGPLKIQDAVADATAGGTLSQ